MITLGSFWDHFRILLGSFWDHFRIVLGSCWDRFGIVSGSFWDGFGIVLGSLWDHFGIVLGSTEFISKNPMIGAPGRSSAHGRMMRPGRGLIIRPLNPSLPISALVIPIRTPTIPCLSVEKTVANCNLGVLRLSLIHI